MSRIVFIIFITLIVISCRNDLKTIKNTPSRTFETSFETESDFNDF